MWIFDTYTYYEGGELRYGQSYISGTIKSLHRNRQAVILNELIMKPNNLLGNF